jgi:hypothetical protein
MGIVPHGAGFDLTIKAHPAAPSSDAVPGLSGGGDILKEKSVS